jgi:PTS system N-acetylglucosamine-specific IIC component
MYNWKFNKFNLQNIFYRGGSKMKNALGNLQKLGKALMMPVAVLPAAALLLRLGAPDVFNVPVIMAAGGAIFDNLPLIFALGVSMGLAGGAGAAALAGGVGYYVLTKVAVTMNKDINMGVLGGIIAGIVAASLYNKYKDTKLPDYLGFFGGRRFVPIITSVAALILGIVFGFVWPPIQKVIYAAGEWAIGAGALGVAVYGFLNRLLIPFGLHHVINSLVWFVFGEFTNSAGKVVTGDLNRFFAGDPSAGIFMTGFFPIMMFGLPAACIAMLHEAKESQRRAVSGVLISAALTSFLTGITEPRAHRVCLHVPGAGALPHSRPSDRHGPGYHLYTGYKGRLWVFSGPHRLCH